MTPSAARVCPPPDNGLRQLVAARRVEGSLFLLARYFRSSATKRTSVHLTCRVAYRSAVMHIKIIGKRRGGEPHDERNHFRSMLAAGGGSIRKTL